LRLQTPPQLLKRRTPFLIYLRQLPSPELDCSPRPLLHHSQCLRQLLLSCPRQLLPLSPSQRTRPVTIRLQILYLPLPLLLFLRQLLPPALGLVSQTLQAPSLSLFLLPAPSLSLFLLPALKFCLLAQDLVVSFDLLLRKFRLYPLLRGCGRSSRGRSCWRRRRGLSGLLQP